MGLADHEFNISPEQLAGLVTDASDLQGTADLIEGQIAGFLDNIVGSTGSATAFGSVGRGMYDHGGSDPSGFGRNQGITRSKGRADSYGVGLFNIGGAGGGWASGSAAAGNWGRWEAAANRWSDRRRASDAAVNQYGADSEEAADAADAEEVARKEADRLRELVFGPSQFVIKIYPRPVPDGETSSGSIGPREHLWQWLEKLRTGGGLVEPVDSRGGGSLGVRTPSIFNANDPTDEPLAASGGSIFWWGSELDDPGPEAT